MFKPISMHVQSIGFLSDFFIQIQMVECALGNSNFLLKDAN